MSHANNSMRTPLARVRGLGSAKSGTDHFWKQRLTAIANIPLVISFIVIVVSLIGRDHASAVRFLGHPLVAILLLLLIGSATFHMRLGMQVIIEDYVHGEGAKIALLILNTFFAIGVAAACTFAVLKLSLGI